MPEQSRNSSRRLFFAAIGAVVAVTSGVKVMNGWPQQAPSSSGSRRPIVVELFTSEGCSTCPPADALLARFAKEQPIEGAEVIALEEHVDYWNQQGWMDPFSSHAWTTRQQEYIWKFKEKDVYTPQVVIDGEKEFVGNREQEIRAAVQEAVQHEKTEIALEAGKSSGDAAEEVSVRIGKLTGGSGSNAAEVWLAVAESGLESDVKSGENAGKNLRHAAVVRSLRKIGEAPLDSDPSFETVTQVKLKPYRKRENLSVVVFVQEKKTLRLLGAVSMAVSDYAR